MISFKQAITLIDIENSYSKLEGEGNDVLRVPSSLRHGGGLGITAALIQFFAAWTRTRKNPILRLYASDDHVSSLATFAQEPHGIAALYFTPSFSDSTEQIQPAKVGLAHAVGRIEAMQSGNYRETMHGRGIFLACFAGAKNEYLLPFYSKGESDSLRGREDFARLTEQLIDACAPSANRYLQPRHVKAVANLVYELFRNTDEHAQTDENGNRYQRNMRGLLVKFVSKSKSTISSEVTAEDVSQNLFMLRTLANSRLHPVEGGRPRSVSDVAFLELTVFDTGPGLVRRWLNRHSPGKKLEEIHIDEELQFVRQCFEQHATTKDNRGSGNGLSLVVSSLKEINAFLRLRTGRVCLYQDFSSKSSITFSPKHWLSNRLELQMVAGTAYTIIIPLSREVK